jgi:hypothetical protein
MTTINYYIHSTEFWRGVIIGVVVLIALAVFEKWMNK